MSVRVAFCIEKSHVNADVASGVVTAFLSCRRFRESDFVQPVFSTSALPGFVPIGMVVFVRYTSMRYSV